MRLRFGFGWNKIKILGLFILFTSINAYSQESSIQDLENELNKIDINEDKKTAVQLNYQIALLHWQSKNLKNAASYFLKGTEISEAASFIKLAQEGRYNLGFVQVSLSDYNSAYKNFKSSYDHSKVIDDRLKMAESKFQMGKCYSYRNKDKKAIDEFEEALKHGISLNNYQVKKDCYLSLTEAYKKIGNTSKAEEHASNYRLLVHDQELNEQMKKLEAEVGSVKKELKISGERLGDAEVSLATVQEISEKRQLEIGLLNTEKELTSVKLQAKEAELKNNRLVRNSLIAGVALASLLAFVVFRGYRNKVKTNEKIHKQNINIKSSINYAKRIQHAMLPKQEVFDALFPKSFVFFRPRDVVSGDFYWIKKLSPNGDKIAIAAVDCTGHGVPGAFVSMIGMNALNSIISQGITEPDEILNHLHTNIHNSLKQDESGNQDGMDLSLCVIDTAAKKLHFAGAKNHLIYFKEGEIFQIRGDKFAIGGSRKVAYQYNKYEIDLNGEMFFYLYSDGYVDQFGGNENMKFMSKRFKALLQSIVHLPMNEQKDQMEMEFTNWKKDQKQTDDVLVLGFSFAG
jgi:serine phosphatase RsbU (regulator of sigma subunit)